jgi:hypothetical protein
MQQQLALTSKPNQEFRTTLQINEENVSFLFRFSYNLIADYWTMKVTNTSTGEILLDSIPLVTGVNYTSTLNILRPFGYLAIGEAYLAPIVSKPTTDFPNDENLGKDKEFVLVWEDNL